MNEILKNIESELGELGLESQITDGIKSNLPTELKEIHNYKIFGSDLLAVPAELIINGDDEEYEKPFSFLDSEDGFDNFENEFRQDIPENLIPIGYLYGADEIVLYKKEKNSIHIFHVSDIVDKDWMKYKLDNPICGFDEFIRQIRVQTVTCLINPNNYSEALLIELRNDKIYSDYEFLELKSEDIWQEYINECNSQIVNGMEIHYAPQKVIKEIKN